MTEPERPPVEPLREALARAIEGGYAESSIDIPLYHLDPVYYAIVSEVRKHRAALAAEPRPEGPRLTRHDYPAPERGEGEAYLDWTAHTKLEAAPRPEGLDAETGSLIRELAEAYHQTGSIRDHVDTTQNAGWTVAGIETCRDPLCVAALDRLG